mmetsp:Transcript_51147/g.70991  ORF Transcript_51147/g.70991 Transcript_51147/m.70991 type:complete len:212 (+) Transcript_51147:693-1328(+)
MPRRPWEQRSRPHRGQSELRWRPCPWQRTQWPLARTQLQWAGPTQSANCRRLHPAAFPSLLPAFRRPVRSQPLHLYQKRLVLLACLWQMCLPCPHHRGPWPSLPPAPPLKPRPRHPGQRLSLASGPAQSGGDGPAEPFDCCLLAVRRPTLLHEADAVCTPGSTAAKRHPPPPSSPVPSSHRHAASSLLSAYLQHPSCPRFVDTLLLRNSSI